MRNIRRVPGVLSVLLLAGTLAACSGGGGGTASSGEMRDENAKGPARAVAPSAGPAGARPVTAPPPAARAVVYTAHLKIRSEDVEKSAETAKRLATDAGGYVEEERGETDPPSATLELKIPAEKYTGLLPGFTTRLGTKVSLRQDAEDVTAEVADVDSRVRSAEASLESFRRLLARAKTVGEIMSIEQEIANREADLESLQARQKSLRQRTRYATLNITIEEPPAAPGGDGTFADGLRAGWDAFTTSLRIGGVALGWLLPFLGALALIGMPALVVARRVNRRRPGGPDRPGPRDGA
ncbi:DUF4349 domain-containing protein [Spirillospora albida]|uniref:DUF4349 domain-containing protein n=1 Tax=Spirillospora albida TaxID=58123 RepID=UPI000691A215|nr:DUF4349 domain-containing protein [Spirillospora albida]